MGIFEIISAIILIIACVFIVVVVLMKDTKTQMSQTISGSTADSYYGKNSGRTKDAMLNKATVAATVVFFVLAVLVNVINIYFGVSKTDDTANDTSVNDMADIPVPGDEGDASITVEADGAAGVTAEADNSEAGNSEAEAAVPAQTEGSADSAAPAATAEAAAPAAESVSE